MAKLPTVDIKGKPYVQVKDRIVALKEETKGAYSIETDYVYFSDRKMWVVTATVKTDKGIYKGHAQEVESTDKIKVNFTSALENAETSAVGRAIGMLGIGVLDSFASANEVEKAQKRIVNATTGEIQNTPAATTQTPKTQFKPIPCSNCGSLKGMTLPVIKFSTSAYGKPLCRTCQNKDTAKDAATILSDTKKQDQVYAPDELDALNNF